MISLIVFDLDGTIVDSEEGLIKTLNETLAHYGIGTLPKNKIRKLIGPRLYDTFRVKFKQNHEKSTEMTECFRKIYSEKYVFEGSVYPGMPNLLKKIKEKGIKTAIVTNKREDYVQPIAEHFGFAEFFDKMYGTDFENKTEKWELLEKCVKEFGVDKKNAVMVGDTAFDYDAAEKCGMKFLPVSHGYGDWTGKKSYSAEELKRILLG